MCIYTYVAPYYYSGYCHNWCDFPVALYFAPYHAKYTSRVRRLEAGAVSSSSSISIITKNLSDMCVGAFGFYVIGWGLAFGTNDSGGANPITGEGDFLLLPPYTDFMAWIWSWSFASTSTTILSGAVAGRTGFRAYVVLSLWIICLAYPLAAHWIWGTDGWAGELGVIDFAGSAAVHLCGGSAGLVGTVLLGPRTGVFSPSGRYFPTRSSPLNTIFGCILLVIAWVAFDASSTGSIANGAEVTAGLAGVNTAIASGTGCIVSIVWSYIQHPAYVDTNEIVTGVISALVCVTAPCASIQPWEAAIIGVIGSVIGMLSGHLFVWFRIDDPVAALPCHFINGIMGMLMVGLFANDHTLPGNEYIYGTDTSTPGLFHGGGLRQFGVQLATSCAVALIGGLSCALGILVTGLCIPVRVTEDEEKRGLDEAEHNHVLVRLTEITPVDEDGQSIDEDDDFERDSDNDDKDNGTGGGTGGGTDGRTETSGSTMRRRKKHGGGRRMSQEDIAKVASAVASASAAVLPATSSAALMGGAPHSMGDPTGVHERPGLPTGPDSADKGVLLPTSEDRRATTDTSGRWEGQSRSVGGGGPNHDARSERSGASMGSSTSMFPAGAPGMTQEQLQAHVMNAVKAALQAVGVDDSGGSIGRKRSSIHRTGSRASNGKRGGKKRGMNKRKSLVRHRSERTYFTQQEINEVLQEKKDELVYTKQGEEHDELVESENEGEDGTGGEGKNGQEGGSQGGAAGPAHATVGSDDEGAQQVWTAGHSEVGGGGGGAVGGAHGGVLKAVGSGLELGYMPTGRSKEKASGNSGKQAEGGSSGSQVPFKRQDSLDDIDNLKNTLRKSTSAHAGAAAGNQTGDASARYFVKSKGGVQGNGYASHGESTTGHTKHGHRQSNTSHGITDDLKSVGWDSTTGSAKPPAGHGFQVGRGRKASSGTGSQGSGSYVGKGGVVKVAVEAPASSSLRIKPSNDEASEFLASMRVTGGVKKVVAEGDMQLSPRSSMVARQRAQARSQRLPMFGDAAGVQAIPAHLYRAAFEKQGGQ